MGSNVRSANRNLRAKYRNRLRAMGCECGICKGLYGPIHYEEPSSYEYPLSFVIDEIIPVSRWKEYGYPSARACCEDFNNLQAAHYFCNQKKSNSVGLSITEILSKTKQVQKHVNISDGDW